MTKKEIAEIRKQLVDENCGITYIATCYVDGERNKVSTMKQRYLTLPEEERFKYYEILKKVLSGTLDKNLILLEFPLDAQMGEGGQKFLYELKQSKLEDDEKIEQFFDKIIDAFTSPEHYLITLIFAAYDVKGITTDGLDLDDGSTEVYEYMIAAICPVKLSKPGLSYHATENAFHNRNQDWIVEMPESGFLFPAFEDRSADIYKTLFYTKKAGDMHPDFLNQIFSITEQPLSALDQKDAFCALIEDTLQEECTFEMVRDIHETLADHMAEQEENPEPLTLDRTSFRNLLEESGVEEEKLENFEEHFDETAGVRTQLVAANVASTRKFEIRTADVTVSVNPDRTDLIQERILDGRRCLVIGLESDVLVNGIPVYGKPVKNDAEETMENS